MSRRQSYRDSDLIIIRGLDHMLGAFVQVSSIKYSNHPEDIQGEGYIFEADEAFGITTNLIEAKPEDISDDGKLIKLSREFVQTIV